MNVIRTMHVAFSESISMMLADGSLGARSGVLHFFLERAKRCREMGVAAKLKEFEDVRSPLCVHAACATWLNRGS